MASSINLDNGGELFNIHLDSSGNLLFNANNVDGAGNIRMSINDDSGNVGIGTTDANRLLHVQGQEIHSGGGVGGHSFGNRETAGFVEVPANGERWVWYSTGGVARLWSGGDKVFVTTSGRVGIGIGAPNCLLHVQGQEIHSGGGAGGHSFGNRETAGFVEIPANGERWVWYSTGGVARLWSGGDKVFVTPSGSVGIGIGAPNRLLHVQGQEIHSGGGAGGHSFGNRETAGFVEIPANGERWVWYSTGGVARLWSGGDKVFVTPSGSVGIGIGAPNRLLHVQGQEIHSGGGAGGHSFGNRETAGFVEIPANGERWVWYSTGGVARLWSGGDKVFVTPSGSVGIGIGAPNRLLHVQGQEIHSGGGAGGHSFGNRETAGFVEIPANGERWVWYSTGGVARLWSGGDKVFVTP